MNHQGSGRGQGVGTAGADGRHAFAGLDHVPGPADQQKVFLVGGDEHRFQAAQVAVGAPVLGQLRGGTGHVALEILEAGFEALQKGEGVGRRPGKARQDLAVVQTPDLMSIAFHDDVAQRHLAVAPERDFAVMPDGKDGGRMKFVQNVFHFKTYLWVAIPIAP